MRPSGTVADAAEYGRGLAFVAGATGFTGREVVRALAEKGVPCVAHVRPDSSRLAEWQERFAGLGAEVDATVWEANAMNQTMKRLMPSHVFGLLGTVRARMRQAKKAGRDPREESYSAVDYGLTALLMRAARDSGARPRFIYLSAVGVTDQARSAYYAARVRVERELRESGLEYVIARPSFIAGPGRDNARPAERMAITIADRVLALGNALGVRGPYQRYASITNVALADALVRLALDPGAANQVFEPERLRS